MRMDQHEMAAFETTEAHKRAERMDAWATEAAEHGAEAEASHMDDLLRHPETVTADDLSDLAWYWERHGDDAVTGLTEARLDEIEATLKARTVPAARAA